MEKNKKWIIGALVGAAVTGLSILGFVKAKKDAEQTEEGYYELESENTDVNDVEETVE